MNSSGAQQERVANLVVLSRRELLELLRVALSVLLLVVFLAACEWAPGPDTGITLRERPSPEREKYGQHYDLKKYEQCRAQEPRNSQCDKYKLVRIESPEFWPFPDVAPIKWPEPPQRAQFRRGMSGDEYFKELCEKEAGEFIYRTVEDVEGLYMIRPRARPESQAYNDRYALEDPYGIGGGDDWPEAPWIFVGITDRKLRKTQTQPYSFYKYLYLEAPVVELNLPDHRRHRFDPSIFFSPPSWARSQIFHGSNGEETSLRRAFRRDIHSKYGFTWRDVRRPFDRELGIGGGEVAVVDLGTNEVLGVRRGFQRGISGEHPSFDFIWAGAMCPGYAHLPGHRNRDRDGDAVLWFLTKVARPKLGYKYEIVEE